MLISVQILSVNVKNILLVQEQPDSSVLRSLVQT